MTSHEGQPDQTIASVITPPGRSAVAVVRISGDIEAHPALPSLFAAANGRPLFEQSNGRVIYGQWGIETPEDVVACRVDSETLEIHCHGGRAASERILFDLSAAGIPQHKASRLTFDEELGLALSRTRTVRTADHVLAQRNGAFAAAIREIANETDPARAVARIDATLQLAEFGHHLTTPWRVAVCGKPNVGKSSLINALVGYERAIVYDLPGTTRDIVSAETALDGWPIEFVDTAGIRSTEDEIESAGIERARAIIAQADTRLLLLDVSTPLAVEDHELLETIPSPVIVLHKSDLPAVWEWSELQSCHADFDACKVSSTTQLGLSELQTAIVARLIPVLPPIDAGIPIVERHQHLLQQARDAALDGDRSMLHSILGKIIER